MRIGIISDTHDNLPAIERAVSFFNKQKLSFVFHAGDYIAPFTIAHINRLSCDWRGVLGNNDGETEGLVRVSENRITKGVLRVELGGIKIVMAHDRSILDVKQEKADLVICGHTHKPEINRVAGKLIVNPGEACGWLSGRSTVAVADLGDKTARIHTI
jgi:hypothetical protein